MAATSAVVPQAAMPPNNMQGAVYGSFPNQQALSCIACRVALQDLDDQRDHYRTEWHRFNLKRKVASLPPVDLQIFQSRVSAEAAATAPKNETFSAECPLCSKHYSSENAYASHMRSKKHREKEAAAGGSAAVHMVAPNRGSRPDPAVSAAPSSSAGPSASAPEDETRRPLPPVGAGVGFLPPPSTPPPSNAPIDEEDEEQDKMAVEDETEEEAMQRKLRAAKHLALEECLFCRHRSDSFDLNIEHMTRAHSFFIPDIEYLADLRGLIRYLGEKVSVGNICLYCDGKGRSFQTMEAVQAHMVDKSHCKMRYEFDDVEGEYDEFYDYDQGSDAEDGEDDGEWVEAESEDEDIVETAPDGTQGRQRGRASKGAIVPVSTTEPVRALDVSDATMELIFSDGSRRGHRAFLRYYKQRPKPAEAREQVLINQLISSYRLLGMPTGTGRDVSLSTRLHSIPSRGEVDAVAQRRANAWRMRLGIKANKTERGVRKNFLAANSGH